MPEVPKIFHFVIQAQAQTASVAERIKRWVTRNPGWKAQVWCDSQTLGQNHVVASAQAPNVEVKTIDPNAFAGAKGDAVRFQILQKFGGCYLDADAEPGDPVPALTVGDDDAIMAWTKGGKTEITAMACTIGSHRAGHLASCVNQTMDHVVEAAVAAPSQPFPQKCVKAAGVQ